MTHKTTSTTYNQTKQTDKNMEEKQPTAFFLSVKM